MIVDAGENGRTAEGNASDVDPAVETQARCWRFRAGCVDICYCICLHVPC